MQKWEYLTVQLEADEPLRLQIPQMVSGLVNGQMQINEQPLYQLVSQFGNDGWEMSGTVSMGKRFYLFFKRPQP